MIKYIFYSAVISVFMMSCQQNQEHININASIQKGDELPENPLLMIPFTSSIQPKNSTMSTLYGNKIAANYARTNPNSNYPEGSILYEVTWKQKPDDVWFGGNIPDEIIKVERVVFQEQNIPSYQLYEGNPLKRIYSKDDEVRIKAIVSQKMAVSP